MRSVVWRRVASDLQHGRRARRSPSFVSDIGVRPHRLRTRIAILLAALCGACLCIALEVRAQSPYPAHAVKGAFIYRMTGYVEWPASALQHERFTFAVVGANEIADELERLLTNRTIKNLPVSIRRGSAIAGQSDAQVLVVGANYTGNLSRDLAQMGVRPVLTITDLPEGLEQGSIVNFIGIDRHVRFEISLPAAQRAGLGIGSELLSVAARVRRSAKQELSPCTVEPCSKSRESGESHVGR
jgi:YfiR/HmsC-like